MGNDCAMSLAYSVGYAAGFIDGEGCFSFGYVRNTGHTNRKGRDRYPYYCIHISQKHVGPLLRLQKDWGGRLYFNDKHGSDGGMWCWKLFPNTGLLDLLDSISGHLTLKKTEAEILGFIPRKNFGTKMDMDDESYFWKCAAVDMLRDFKALNREYITKRIVQKRKEYNGKNI